MLPPRSRSAPLPASPAIAPIATPAAGLVVYDTTLQSLSNYNGTAWISYSLPIATTQDLWSVSMSSERNGWIIGDWGIQFHWDGENWLSPSEALSSITSDISVPNDTSAWGVGGVIICGGSSPCVPEVVWSDISYWDGKTWWQNQITDFRLSYIAMISDTDGWAVGTEFIDPTMQRRSAIMHLDGTSWSNVPHPYAYETEPFQQILGEVSALNSTNAWVVVQNQNKFLRWDGTIWTEENSPVGGNPAIATISSNDAWSVGGEGVIAHWDGSQWLQVSSPVTETLTSVAMVSSNDGWAVGRGGIILHFNGIPYYLPLVIK